MARPSKLTPEVTASIANRIRAGASLAEAAEAEDISDRTAREWLAAGNTDSTGPYGAFALAVARANQARASVHGGQIDEGVVSTDTPAPVETLPAPAGFELLDAEALRRPAHAWLDAKATAEGYRANKDRARVRVAELRNELVEELPRQIQRAKDAAEGRRQRVLLEGGTPGPDAVLEELLAREKQLRADVESLNAVVQVGQDGINSAAQLAAERTLVAAIREQLDAVLQPRLAELAPLLELSLLFTMAQSPGVGLALNTVRPNNGGWLIPPGVVATRQLGSYGWLQAVAERAAS